MTRKKPTTLTEAVRQNRLVSQLDAYLRQCRPTEEAGNAKRSGGTFPNLAGFCRYLGCGLGELEVLRAYDPSAADFLCTVFEDEAINRSPTLSPTVVSAYLKRRLGYGEKAEPGNDSGELKLIFEHDISEDGV